MADRAQIDAARQGLRILRSMRGAAGKVAQLADFVDPAWAPAAERPRLEEHLAELRGGAPEPLPFKRIEKALRDAWGGRISDHVAELDPEPAAMASAGQVHRGELDDGRAVAVKVLHPGLEEVLRADLGNLTLLAQLATTVVPGLDPRALAAEIRDRALEEMDLEHEAQSQRAFARAYRDHPFVFVPAPLTDLCHTGVLVSEWVEGEPFEAVCAMDAGARDRYGEILARFFAGAGLHTGQFHADAHPGNHRLMDDGRVGFVDFGSVGTAEPAWVAQVLDAADAAEGGDGDRFRADLAALGYLAAPERHDGAWLADHAVRSAGRLRSGRTPVTIDLDLVEELGAIQDSARPALLDLGPHLRLPARDLLAGRMLGGLGTVLLRLRATAPWDAIAAELRHGHEPHSELGEAEAAFWSARGHSRGATVQELRRAA